MSTKFSRKTFLKGSVAGLGMMALNVCTAGAASAAEPAAAAAEDTNSLNLVPKKAASVKVTSRGSVSGGSLTAAICAYDAMTGEGPDVEAVSPYDGACECFEE